MLPLTLLINIFLSSALGILVSIVVVGAIKYVVIPYISIELNKLLQGLRYTFEYNEK